MTFLDHKGARGIVLELLWEIFDQQDENKEKKAEAGEKHRQAKAVDRRTLPDSSRLYVEWA